MSLIYDIIVCITWFFLKLTAFFHPKIRLFVNGRKLVFPTLEKAGLQTEDVIWMHVASLGEFEQGLPIIQKLKEEYASYKILVTFFSPSGYEVKKNTTAADVVIYLPMDTKSNVTRFLTLTKPQLAIFVKYEIWPNFLKGLDKRNIPTLLVSAIFKEHQIYFKGYGHFLRKALRTFDHFFVQDENSKKLLESIQLNNVTISGDTRFDRVAEILERDNTLSFMAKFKNGEICITAGSSWPEDEVFLVDFINTSTNPVKYVIAPHNIKKDHISSLKNSISKKVVLYSELEENGLSKTDVIIIDTIGLLTKIYSYADIAYVGGGFATGLHNTLEPAVFGIPVVIGPNFKGFKEAEDLVALKGILSVGDKKAFFDILYRLVSDTRYREKTGEINTNYITQNKGANLQIIDRIHTLL